MQHLVWSVNLPLLSEFIISYYPFLPNLIHIILSMMFLCLINHFRVLNKDQIRNVGRYLDEVNYK